ncbi:MAG: ferritin-like domain-containing protein [Acidobacteria bacterium]|nr:ferritin-like domain-containing protein [Acidobacteriota bacterium]
MSLSENERWILSFYRTSEINGSLFFGRLAKSLPPGPVQHDMTKHFSDEGLHAWYWTSCLEKLGTEPLRLDETYQERYLVAAGLPVNLMEILAITLIFEKRVIGQYGLHRAAPNIRPEVRETFDLIMEDEKWHIEWVSKALGALKPEYGEERVKQTLERFREADRDVYESVLREHEERLEELMQNRRRRRSGSE